MAQPEKLLNVFQNRTTGGEAEPSPPYGRIAQDTPSLNRHPYQLRYGAGLAQQTFRSVLLSSPARQTSQNFPPEPGIPATLVVSTSSAAAAISHITETHQLDGMVILSGGITRDGQHAGSCI